MSYLLKKLAPLFLALYAISPLAIADSHKIIASYTELVDALGRGNEVKAVITIGKCQIPGNTSDGSGGTISGIKFTDFLKYTKHDYGVSKNLISTYRTTLIEHNQYGPVYDITRVRVFEDNFVEIFDELVHPVTYLSLSVTKTNCRLSNGNDKNGVLLFDLG